MYKTYEVGGCVRDAFMGLRSKDVDFVVLAPNFDAMREFLVQEGFRVHTETPDKFTIRAGVPRDHPLRERTKDADFVMARRDGPYSDGRRPDYVEPGSLHDDLARRDFTVNAIAKDPLTGEIIDPFGGRADILDRTLRFVGDPYERIREDGIRVLRAYRFMVTKGFRPTASTWAALRSQLAVDMLDAVSVERIYDELNRMLKFDTPATITLLSSLGSDLTAAIFRDGLHLESSLKKVD